MEGARLHDPEIRPEEEKGDFSWLSAIAFVFLTYNTATAAYRSIHDPWALAFVLTAYVDLACLFWCLRRFERSDAKSKPRLKVAVWLLATLLTGMFSCKVASIMPWPLAAIVWGMASATTFGGFYAFFIYEQPASEKHLRKSDLLKEQN